MNGPGSRQEMLSKEIHEAQAGLLCRLASSAQLDEETFFQELRGSLDSVCKSIAKALDAKSAAIFFITEDGRVPKMVMRGASGRLKETLKSHDQWRTANPSEPLENGPPGVCYPSKINHTWRKNPGQRRDILKDWSVTNQIWHLARGRIANSNATMDLLQGGSRRLGAGDDRAYPNRDLTTTFRSMVGVPIFIRGGRTEHSEFPAEADQAKGESTASEEEKGHGSRESLRAEFLSKYRVVGILKVEGKFPQEMGGDWQQFEKKIEEILGETFGKDRPDWTSWIEAIRTGMTGDQSPPENREFPKDEYPKKLVFTGSDLGNVKKLAKKILGGDDPVATWIRNHIEKEENAYLQSSIESTTLLRPKLLDLLNGLVSEEAIQLPRNVPGLHLRKATRKLLKQEDLDKAESRLLNRLVIEDAFPDEFNRTDIAKIKRVADAFSDRCRAEFSHHDVEMLVLFAMQLGRIMIQRVIKHAVKEPYNIVFSENDVGVLNIRWADVEQLDLLRTAAEAALLKVISHIDELKVDLDFAEHRRIHAERVSDLLQPRGPIRATDCRVKKMRSLLPKLVRKQIEAEQNPEFSELEIPGFKVNLENQSRLAERRTSVRGWAQLDVDPPNLGSTPTRLEADLGVKGGPKAHSHHTEYRATLTGHRRHIDLNRPLVERIYDSAFYGIDDFAGVRIITDYVTDIDKVRGEILGRQNRWGIEVKKVDDALLEGKDGGYRGVHMTVVVDVDELLPIERVNQLKHCLYSTTEARAADFPLKIPVEIQLRTAYEHSWSEKSHNLSYRREEQIAPALRESLKILSNLLYQADELSDVVRASIIRMLLPDDFGEMKLLEFLKPRLTRHGFVQLILGLACSKAILKDKLSYSGRPRYSHAIEVCETLVQEFGVLDTDMFLLALLREIWDTNGSDHLTTQSDEPESGEPRDLFERRFQTICGQIYPPFLRQLYPRIPDSELLDHWLDDFPAWFWAMHISFRKFFQQKEEDPLQKRLERLDELRRNIVRYFKQGGHEKPAELLERAYVLESSVLIAQLSELPNQPSKGRRKQYFREYFGIFAKIRRLFPDTPMKSKVVEVLDRAFRKIAADQELAMPMNLDE